MITASEVLAPGYWPYCFGLMVAQGIVSKMPARGAYLLDGGWERKEGTGITIYLQGHALKEWTSFH